MAGFKIFLTNILIFMVLTTAAWGQDKIIAVVNNEVISQKDLDNFLNFMQMQLAEQYKGAQLEEKIQAMKPDLLRRLVEDRLILQEAKKNNVEIDSARIKAKIAEVKKRYASEGEFQAALRQQGLVEADLENRIKEQMLMYNIIETKVKEKIVITPAEITDFYNQNLSQFMLAEQRELQSLVVDKEAVAKNIATDLKSGKDINDLAQNYAVKTNNMSISKGELKKEIEDVLFALKVGEVTEPIQKNDSFYVFKLIKIYPPRQAALAEVQDEIHALLYEKKMQEGLSLFIDELKKSAYIKISQ